MRRSLPSLAAILLFLAPAAAWAQGLLIVVDPNAADPPELLEGPTLDVGALGYIGWYDQRLTPQSFHLPGKLLQPACAPSRQRQANLLVRQPSCRGRPDPAGSSARAESLNPATSASLPDPGRSCRATSLAGVPLSAL